MTDPTDPQPGESAEDYLGRRIAEAVNEGGALADELRRAYESEHGEGNDELTNEEGLGHQIAASVPAKYDPFNPPEPEPTTEEQVRADLDAANDKLREMKERNQS